MKNVHESTELLEKIQHAKDIIGDDAIQIISDHLHLDFDSKNRAKCPFHNDDTPSFIWNPTGKYFRCFGCSRVYSILDYLVDIKGSYKEAINELFRMAHIEDNLYGYKPFEGGHTDWFENYQYPHAENDPTNEHTIKYLGLRGISPETINYAGVKEDQYGNIAFEYRDLDDKLLVVKYRPSRKVSHNESKMWFQKNASTVPLLWNVKKLDFTKPLVITEGECFTGDTEVFTTNGWKRLDKYDNEKVLQVLPNGRVEFTNPVAIIRKQYDGNMVELSNNDNYSSLTTSNHNIVVVEDSFSKYKASSLKHKNNIRIPTAIHPFGNIHMSPSEITLYVVYMLYGTCTGSMYDNGELQYHTFNISLKKYNNVVMLKPMFDMLNIKYKVEKKDNSYSISFNTKLLPVFKHWKFDWLFTLDSVDLQWWLSEISYWNTIYNKENIVISDCKKDVEILQMLCHLCGVYELLTIVDDTDYSLKIGHNESSVLLNDLSNQYKEFEYRGMVHCLTVPSGMILIRHKNHISISGNCDTLSVIESGYYNACSVPNGAGSVNWLEFNYDFLLNFNNIIIWFDNDSAGQEGIKKIVPRLGEYRCKIIKPSEEDEQMVEDYYNQFGVPNIRKTDANNILLACGKQRVLDLISRAEEIPVKNLKYLMDCEVTNVNDMEKSTTGLKGLDDILYGNLFPCFTIYSGVAGCVDCDTEYFNGIEWKKIKDYTYGEKVLEYDVKNNTAILSQPLDYIKYPCDILYYIGDDSEIEMCLSPEHNVLWYDENGNPYKTRFEEIAKIHSSEYNGFSGKIKGSFVYSGKGVNLTDSEIELMCAIIYNNSSYYNNKQLNNTYVIHLTEECKKNKFRKLLKECNINFNEYESKSVDYTFFCFSIPAYEKEFMTHLYNCNQHQLSIVCKSMLFWGKNNDKKQLSFCTSNKHIADFIQFAFSACDIIANIVTHKGDKKDNIAHTIYEININKNRFYNIGGINKITHRGKITPVNTKDGYKYCFTMPLGTLILRKKDKIFCSFNSGKSSLANIASILSPIEDGHKVFVFSGELDEGQLASWIMSPLAGADHTIVWDNNGGKKGFSVQYDAEQAIRKYYHDNIIMYSAEEELETSGQELLNAMEVAYKKYGCDVFLIDNLMCLTFDDVNADSKWEAQKKFIIRLMNFTKTYGVNTNLVLHPKKPAAGQTDAGIYDLYGASEIGNLCHRMLWIKKLQDDPEGYSIEISIVKDRPSQAAGKKCKLMYDYHTRRFYSTEEEFNRKFSWEKNFTAFIDDDIRKNLMCNRPDIMAEVPRIYDGMNLNDDCDQC